MATTVAEAFVTVRPDMDGFGSDLKSGLGKLTKVAGAAALGIGAAIAGAAAVGLKEFAEFESGMNEVFTLLPGITADAMQAMSDEVRDFSVEMGTTTDEVVPALYQALSAGVPQDTVFDFLEIANKAAIGGITDLETAVDGISSVVNAYGDDVIDATEASDLMFTAVRLGKTDFEQLSSSLFNVIPTAASLGVEFEDITAALATMTAQGVPTNVATTQLRQALVELSREGGAAAETFQELSGKTFSEFVSEGGRLDEALILMADHAEDAGLGVGDLFGSVEAGQAVMALVKGDAESFTAALDEMGDAAGATETAYDTMDTGISRAMERIGAAWEEVQKVLGEELAGPMQAAADWVVEHIPEIRAEFQRLMDRASEMGAALKDWWYTTAKPAVDEFVAAIEEHWPTIRDIFARLGEIVQDIGRVFGRTFDGMTTDVSDGTEGMSSDIGEFLTTLDSLLVTVEWVTSSVAGAWNLLAGGVTLNFEQMGNGIDDLTGGAYSRLRDGTIETMQRVSDTIHEKLDEVVTFFRELPGRILGALGSLDETLRQSGRDLIAGFMGGIRSMAGDAIGAVTDVIGGAVSATKRLLRIESPSKVFEEIGGQMMAGLELGFGGDIGKRLQSLAAPARAPLPVTVTGSAAGGRQMYGDVTIQVTEPLQSTGQDVAHQIRKLAYR